LNITILKFAHSTKTGLLDTMIVQRRLR